MAILAVSIAVLRLRVLEQGAKSETSSLVRRPDGEKVLLAATRPKDKSYGTGRRLSQ